jgi:esterase/lipase superfamily enzyme
MRDRTSWPRMGTTGCSFGGYHAINFALRHPDLVTYAVSMSCRVRHSAAISERPLR